MQDLQSLLGALRRPSLLVRAARFGAAEYRRETQLGRIVGTPFPARSGAALMRLLEIEAEIDAGRRRRAAGYSPARHVEVLAAIIAEARIQQGAVDAPA
ncbi:DUF6477 family protein [Salipiger sp. H15]|uniref:DUF6477 family protein n=1 Tax=Alloyangia sp. H15 TaxID=3029062 RepID=A0AAU8AFN9_9RHOB